MKIPEELYNHIISGNCVLFIGAGVSMEAEAPSAQEIVRELSEQYLQGQHEGEPLSRVAAYVETKPGLGKRSIVNYLVNRLSHLKPSRAHLLIPKFNWAAIYTTNYDTLIEEAYEKSVKGRGRCKPIISSSDLVVDMSDKPRCISVYKLHGCISRPSSLVISEDDYYSASDNRKAIYQSLETHKYRNVFLFIGYSFSDFDLSRIWFDVLKELGKLSQWAYALWPKCSEVQRMTWRARNVELIDMRFDKFMDELNSISHRKEKKKEREVSISNTAIAELVKALLSTIGAKDPSLKEHSLRVQNLALMISKELDITIHERSLIKTAALLHDIGLIAVPDSVFKKPGKLSLSEWEILKGHSMVGEQLFSSISSLKGVANIVRCHHEQFDGTGYPDGLAGENIPLPARIIAVADCLDALMSERPYRSAYTLEEAIAEIDVRPGIQFDPRVVKALKSLYGHNKLKGLWGSGNAAQ
jgi:putative nucleotidyltransferase with HDIG domain